MKRVISVVVVLLLTFSMGVISKSVWGVFLHWNTRRPPTGIAQKVGPYWIYTNQVVNAEAPLNAGDEPIKARDESVFIVFYPTGEFASIGCALSMADGVENMRLVSEDEFIVYKGKWKRNGDGTITTTSKLTHRPGQSHQSLADERTVIFKPIANMVAELGLLEADERSYVQMVAAKIKNLDELPRMIAADNR
jgi:hypothetical protein